MILHIIIVAEDVKGQCHILMIKLQFSTSPPVMNNDARGENVASLPEPGSLTLRGAYASLPPLPLTLLVNCEIAKPNLLPQSSVLPTPNGNCQPF